MLNLYTSHIAYPTTARALGDNNLHSIWKCCLSQNTTSKHGRLTHNFNAQINANNSHLHCYLQIHCRVVLKKKLIHWVNDMLKHEWIWKSVAMKQNWQKNLHALIINNYIDISWKRDPRQMPHPKSKPINFTCGENYIGTKLNIFRIVLNSKKCYLDCL